MIDAWQPGAGLQALRARAVLLGVIRAYFSRAGVIQRSNPCGLGIRVRVIREG